MNKTDMISIIFKTSPGHRNKILTIINTTIKIKIITGGPIQVRIQNKILDLYYDVQFGFVMGRPHWITI